MHLRLSLGLVLLTSVLFAQSLDPDTQLLVDHLNADRDIFGVGSPRMLQLGRSLEDQARSTGKDLRFVVIEDEMISEFFDSKLPGTEKAADKFFKLAVASNDIVIVGIVEKQSSMLNTYKTGIVTDSLFRISDVLHDKHEIGLRPGDGIVVTRRGGRLRIDEQVIDVKVEGFPAFEVGEKYLLFLRRQTISGSYAVQRSDAFLIDGTSIRPLATIPKSNPAVPYFKDPEAFFETVRNFAGASPMP